MSTIKPNYDAYAFMARFIFQKEYNEITRQERMYAKEIVLKAAFDAGKIAPTFDDTIPMYSEDVIFMD
jgi:hypothetical protein